MRRRAVVRAAQRLPAPVRRAINAARGIATPALLDRPPGSPVAVLSPHPDDDVLGCGGTLCKHLAAGDPVSVIHLTGGERTAGLGRSDATATREAEAVAGWAAAGPAPAPTLHFLRRREGEVAAATGELRDAIRSVGPALLYAPWPLDAHRDHVDTAAALAGIVDQLESVALVALYEVWTPLVATCLVDVTAQFPAKLRAIEAHSSANTVVDHRRVATGLASYRSAQVLHGSGYAEAFCLLAPDAFASMVAGLDR